MAEWLLLSLSYIIHNSAKGISFERSLRGNVLSLPHEEMEQLLLLQNEWKGGKKQLFCREMGSVSLQRRLLDQERSGQSWGALKTFGCVNSSLCAVREPG